MNSILKSIVDFVICITLLLAFNFGLKSGLSIKVAIIPVVIIAVYIVLISPYRGIILICSLGAFNSLHHLLFQDINFMNEPTYYKGIKDIVYAGLFINLLFKNKSRKDIDYIRLLKVMWPLVIFMCYIFVHGLISLPTGSLTNVAVVWRYLIAYPFLVFLGVGVFDSAKKSETFFDMLVLIGIIVSIIGFWEVGNDQRTYYWGYVNLGPIHQRTISSLQNPNNCAIFLSIPFCYLVFRFVSKRTTIMNIVSFAILFSCMFLTFSRSVFVSVSIGLFIMMIMLRSITAFLFSTPIILLTVVSILETSASRMHVQLAEKAGTSVNYFERLLFAAERTKGVWGGDTGLEWFTGVGFGSDKMVTTDNMYAFLFLGGGFFAVLLFVVLMYSLLSTFRKAIRTVSPEMREFSILIICILVSTVVHMFSAITLELYPYSIIFWILVSMVFGFYFRKVPVAK